MYFDIGLPFLFMFLGAISKKLGRGPGWVVEEDFSFGVELSIATIANALLEIVQVAKLLKGHTREAELLQKALLAYVGFSAVMIVIFAIQIIVLQEQKNNSYPLAVKRFMLLGFSNLLGIGLFLYFIMNVKFTFPCV